MNTATVNLDALAPSRFDRLVCANANADGTATLYQRTAPDTVAVQQVPFRPFVLLADPALAEGLEGVTDRRDMHGPGRFRLRVHLADESAHTAAVKQLKTKTGMTPSTPGAPYRVFTDLDQQLLSILPARLFRGLAFADIRRLQLDIETVTAPGYDFPNATRPEDRIVLVALRDSTGWEACLGGPGREEAEILAEMVRLIRERDPDVLEGHNLFGFDLPYIDTRCRQHKIRLALGRDGSRLASRPSRFTAGEHATAYTRYEIRGRQIVDTLHLVQLYDVVNRDLESYGLKSVARHFGVAAPARTYVDPHQIRDILQSDPDRLRAYAMDDVRETDGISRILSPSYFYQAQLIPFSYQSCVTRGNATRIDAMLVATYLNQDESLPEPQPPRPFQGALTDSLKEGLFSNVWHADIRSLYPSIIISQGMKPRQDSLGAFTRALAELRQFRLAAKDLSRSAASRTEREHWDAMQGTFKVLINSFYGYVGFAQGTFNDYGMAEAITARGREILRLMMELIAAQRATVIEVDTDGVYFVPPPTMSAPAEMQAAIQRVLPPGIEVELDATYKAMFCYKSKNYALLAHDGSVSVTGAALKSRGLEPFQRRYIQELITLVLTNRKEEIRALYDRTAAAIRNHEFPLVDLAKREVLSSSPKVYQEKLAAKKTHRSAAFELALASGREYSQGDQVAYYITGEKKNVSPTDAGKLLSSSDPGLRDENIAYYLDKLAKVQERFLPLMYPSGGTPQTGTIQEEGESR